MDSTRDGEDVWVRSDLLSTTALQSTNSINLRCHRHLNSTDGREDWTTMPQLLWRVEEGDGELDKFLIVRGILDQELCWLNRSSVSSDSGTGGFVDLLQPDDPTNQQETFTSSNQEHRLFIADNNPETSWSASPTDTVPTFWVNFGTHHSLSGLFIDWLAYPDALRVETSDNGISWDTIAETNLTADGCSGSQFLSLPSAEALNWIRLQMIGRKCGENEPVGVRDLSFKAELDFCSPFSMRGFDWEVGCDSSVSCIPSMLSRQCGKCPSGYSGTGPDNRGYLPAGCEDIDECSMDQPCYPGVDCYNTGQYLISERYEFRPIDSD